MEETSNKHSPAFQFVELKFYVWMVDKLVYSCAKQIHVANRLWFQKGVKC